MTFYLIIDIDQFIIVNKLIISSKKIDEMIKSHFMPIMNKTIFIGLDELIFFPQSINNITNLMKIIIINASIEFLNINTNVLVNLELLKVRNCTNKHGLKHSFDNNSEKKYIKETAVNINNFFKI